MICNKMRNHPSKITWTDIHQQITFSLVKNITTGKITTPNSEKKVSFKKKTNQDSINIENKIMIETIMNWQKETSFKKRRNQIIK